MAKSEPPVAATRYLELLDDLIVKQYRRLLDPEDEKAKMGEFLKMIEMRHKLTPVGADREAFWKALEKIRKEGLAGNQAASKPPPKRTTRRKTQEKNGG